mmetsp:Transcript_13355/g.25068  ORF Transcript_13355/g.25068 Transcript_13355/m.25068 type:complete len:749 (+) Transcript_13355:97-2343(+)
MQHFLKRTVAQLVKRKFQRHVPSKIGCIVPSTVRPSFNHTGVECKNLSTSLAISVDSDLEEKTERLLNHIYKGDTQGDSYTLIHYDKLMEEWSKQCNLYAAERTEDLLVALEKSYDDSFSQPLTKQASSYLIPNAISYNHVLHAYVLSDGGIRASLKCEEILNQMLERCRNVFSSKDTIEQRLPLPPEPLVTTFNTVMNAWAKSNDINAGIKAEMIFRKMEYWSFECRGNNANGYYKGADPNTRSLAIVVDAWANSRHEDSFERIIAIYEYALEKVLGIEGDEEDNDDDKKEGTIPLNTVFFNSVLHGLANCNGGIKAARKAQEIFTNMQNLNINGVLQRLINTNTRRFEADCDEDDDVETSPNIRTWSLLIKCWANAGEVSDDSDTEYAASSAEAILDQMEHLYKDGQDVKPNSYAFASCIKAWAECASETGAMRAVSVLERMEKLYKVSQEEELRPTNMHYNTCLSALCKVRSEQCINQARNLLERMCVDGTADAVSFNTVMMGYLNFDSTTALQNIESLSDEMQTANISPDSTTFNVMIDAWRKGGHPSAIAKVIKVLDNMIDLSKKDSSIVPTTSTFTLVLNTISSSNLDEKVEPARKIFHDMITLHESRFDDKVKPDVRLFSAFMTCCANQGGAPERKRAALKIALHTYEHMCKSPEYGTPNTYIYGNLMKAVGRLASNPEEKSRLLEHIFNCCIDEGQLSRVTLNVFRKWATQKLQMKVLGNRREIQPSWSRNIREQDRPRA